MAKKKTKQVRVEFRKKYGSRARGDDLLQKFQENQDLETISSERLSGKGELTRHRNVTTSQDSVPSQDSDGIELESDSINLQSGLVLRVHGLESVVRSDSGKEYRCVVRRLLKTLSTDQRQLVVAGDRVSFRAEDNGPGLIMSVEPRQNSISRTSRGRRHVVAANIDQLLIVTSAAEPTIKPHLVDRMIATAEQNNVPSLICINKCDLIDPAELQTLVGTYAQIGYQVLLLSAERGWNIDLLKSMVRNRQSAVTGQSGVGKSSLLNALDDGLQLAIREVSADNQKGKHTTTTAHVLPLSFGGSIVDTPGIRQFQLWDIAPEEMTGLFRDLRPFADRCRFPNCQHQSENDCGVKDAVADGLIDARRYESFCQLVEGDED